MRQRISTILQMHRDQLLLTVKIGPTMLKVTWCFVRGGD